MAFAKGSKAKKNAGNMKCVVCGWQAYKCEAAHIISKKEIKEKKKKGAQAEWNSITLCPNCHDVYENVLCPKLYKALQQFGASGLPDTWEKPIHGGN